MALQMILDDLLKEADQNEGFTPELLDCVDLGIEFTPVIPFQGGTLNDAVDVVKTLGEGYIVQHPLVEGAVSPDVLKRMRLRYLLKSKEQQARAAAPFLARLKNLQ
jgi:hypothetical protein